MRQDNVSVPITLSFFFLSLFKKKIFSKKKKKKRDRRLHFVIHAFFNFHYYLLEFSTQYSSTSWILTAGLHSTPLLPSSTSIQLDFSSTSILLSFFFSFFFWLKLQYFIYGWTPLSYPFVVFSYYFRVLVQSFSYSFPSEYSTVQFLLSSLYRNFTIQFYH